jgi:hypothetical protein
MLTAESDTAQMCSRHWHWEQTLYGLADRFSGDWHTRVRRVELCLRLLSDEIKLSMALAGVVKVDEITKDYLVKMDKSGFVARL